MQLRGTTVNMESFVLALTLVVAASGQDWRSRGADQYSFIVSIHRDSKTRSYLCAGSLIASTWVLTAASCLPRYACKIRYGDMLTFDSPTYSKILKRINHINSRSIYSPTAAKYRITPKTNNIGLAHVEEIFNMTFGLLSGIDYSAIFGRQVTIFHFGLMPVLKSKIYEMNINRLKNHARWKKKTPQRVLFAPFERAGMDNMFVSFDTSLLETAKGIAIPCQMKHFAGPNICVAKKCFDLEETSPPDYGAPLVHGDAIVGVTAELETYYSRHTPVSLYLDWIRKQMTMFTPKQIKRTL